MSKQICRDCHHPSEVHDISGTGECGCGCVRLTPIDFDKRRERYRTWLADVEFFVRNRWIRAPQLRIQAAGQAGAAMRAVRTAKREVLRPYQRVGQVRVTLTPVPKPRVHAVTRG